MAGVYFKKNKVFIPKLIGAFFIWFALVMFVFSCAKMYDSWDAIKNYPNCVGKIGSETSVEARMQYADCKGSLYNITGLQLRGDQYIITARQMFTTLLWPIGQILFWAIVFLVGLFLYEMKFVRVSPQAAQKKKN
jgi:hypothetical protein